MSKKINAINNDLVPYIISTLQMEYSAHRQEIRDLINSMDTNFNTGIIMLSGIVSLTAYKNKLEFLYIIPSIIFIIACIHLLKTASTFVRGTYCQAIEKRLKVLLGKDIVLLEWEDGELGKYVSKPNSIVQTGFNLIFVVLALIFMGIAYLSYEWKCWTLIIHLIEFIATIVYFIFIMRWNSSPQRTKIMQYYNKINSRILKSNKNHSKIQL
jgi:hypothetical protein